MKEYDNYEIFKNWTLFETTKNEKRFFKSILNIESIKSKTIYELGFGSGGILALLKNTNSSLYGYEVNEKLNSVASKNGITIITIEQLIKHPIIFDYIFAFDVLEHTSIEDITRFLLFANICMNKSSQLIIRFPNCSSPLSNPYQQGDLTHISELSYEKIKQLIYNKQLNFNTTIIPNWHQLKFSGLGGRIRLIILIAIQQILAIALGKSAWELAPNIVIKITKK